jgi:hypothetical protein
MNERDRSKLDAIEQLQREQAEYREALQLLGEMVAGRIRCKERLFLQPVPEDQVKERLAKGEPAAPKEELGFSHRRFIAYASGLETLFRKRRVINGQPLNFHWLMDEYEEEGLTLAEMLDRFIGQGEVYNLIVVEGLKPVYHRYGEFYAQVFDPTAWCRPYCYVCGGEPDMAKIEEDNSRTLYCSLCDVSWRYLRLKCPFCGNDQPGLLVTLDLEGYPLYSVDGCRACGRYLKVVDGRAPGRTLFLEVEALLSSRLDRAARDEGFK